MQAGPGSDLEGVGDGCVQQVAEDDARVEVHVVRGGALLARVLVQHVVHFSPDLSMKILFPEKAFAVMRIGFRNWITCLKRLFVSKRSMATYGEVERVSVGMTRFAVLNAVTFVLQVFPDQR